MMSLALLFPGQGSQAVGMGKALLEVSEAARRVFAEADEALQEKLSQIILEGPADELKRTKNTQPAILTMSVAALRALEERGAFAKVTPAFVAGHSLGEYSALVAAGAMPFADAVRAVRARGIFMQQAVPEGKGAMAAVLGMEADAIRAVVEQACASEPYVACANFNGPEQTVIAGSARGVENAAAALKAAGAKRVMPLPVSAPFHCALMEPVKARLDEVLGKIAFAAPRMPVITNVEAAPNQDPTRVRALLVAQVTEPVRFTEIAQHMLGAGISTFVEVGPGKALIGMVKRMSKDVKLCNVEDPASLDAALAAMAG
ncbi:MAG: ACP S-malonyltransferase [Deltaproteobacteria bacterium]|nr:ACP S-malonyltransferase [Deltaproteobacteria bacterium]